MQTVATGLSFDETFRLRVPGDLVPRIHAYARRRGLSSSAWVRMMIISALADDAGATPPDEQCRAA